MWLSHGALGEATGPAALFLHLGGTAGRLIC